ncbi:beta-galactosidase [Caldanaerobius fijiensis DSM 17918]|uniref:Beta-galactosidase n=1 Tax=Caldanaerobius fijiensis DSM 17918 TaxID=1121256 RepID=A0A1M5DLM7_9THEO|nr:beta-galactosidase [Caldanaerobius fijiensis]SHF67801.1 beta-galactosidase [Caldanaerobius fijiensis DSM 17918]
MKVLPPYLGAAYYPEDWPLDKIDEDIALMKEAGINVVRVGEFAWSRMEPEEGVYDFQWLHTVVNKLAEAGIAVIMCTPTCTPPIWLVEKYPEVLVVHDDGTRAQHGARRHACPNNRVYRQYCEKIVTKLAEEFGNDENVIGWQIDNEMYPPRGRGCCCPTCHEKFKDTMRQQFGTIENLNRTWGTDLWSQTYQSFEQLPIPRSDTWHHPSLLTAWMNFQSDSYIEFTKVQVDILHRLAKQPVGTDMMPVNGLNYYKISQVLDVVQFNHYNSMENLWQAAFWMDFIRPLKQVPFWNTETQTCWNGSTTANGYKEKGFCRVNSWLPIALGGEANLYWLWRAHWSGQELMHGSVISSSGRPLHIFDEVKEVSEGFRKAGEFLNNTRPVKSGLAVHFSGYAWWLFEFQPMVNGFRYADKMMNAVYRPLMEAQLRPDIIDPAASLEDYKVILSPFLPTLEESGLSERIKNWVYNGGTWIVGPLSDIRTIHATKYVDAPFGYLEDWGKVYCKYQIPGDPRDFIVQWKDDHTSRGSIWYDGFETRGAEPIAVYTEGPLSGLAAVTRCEMGKGQIIILGTMPTKEDFQRLLLNVAKEAGILPVVASSNVLAVPRSGKAGSGMVVLEIENRPGKLTLEREMIDIITGNVYKGDMDIPPYSAMVLVEK